MSRKSITRPSTTDKRFYLEIVHLFGITYDLKQNRNISKTKQHVLSS